MAMYTPRTADKLDSLLAQEAKQDTLADEEMFVARFDSEGNLVVVQAGTDINWGSKVEEVFPRLDNFGTEGPGTLYQLMEEENGYRWWSEFHLAHTGKAFDEWIVDHDELLELFGADGAQALYVALQRIDERAEADFEVHYRGPWSGSD